MTSKEAVNLFKQYRWRIEENKALEILEELVERDTPKKIVNVGDNKNPYYHCGKCCREMPSANKYFLKYCANCGQHLDWSD